MDLGDLMELKWLYTNGGYNEKSGKFKTADHK